LARGGGRRGGFFRVYAASFNLKDLGGAGERERSSSLQSLEIEKNILFKNCDRAIWLPVKLSQYWPIVRSVLLGKRMVHDYDRTYL
jgi:hypothetical protein